MAEDQSNPRGERLPPVLGGSGSTAMGTLLTLLRRPVLEVAPRLLGCVVRTSVGGEEVAVRLTEVEAYDGARDPASHGFRGPTPRTSVMYGPAGFVYVYFTYGMHWCANVVTGVEGHASAVLLRAGEVVEGIEMARARRPRCRRDVDLARGPARLATCLGIDGSLSGHRIGEPPLTLDLAEPVPDDQVLEGPRVGISKAIDHPWRFWIAGEATVSVHRGSSSS